VGGAEDVIGQEDAFECCVAGGTRCSFVDVRSIARFQICVQDRQFDLQSVADIPALVGPPSRIRVQMMIDMDGAQPHRGNALSTPGERVEQSE